MEYFQSSLTIRDLHNYKGVPYVSHMNGLGFFGNNIGVARVYGMHFSKKRSWRAVLMTIPDNHKMA